MHLESEDQEHEKKKQDLSVSSVGVFSGLWM